LCHETGGIIAMKQFTVVSALFLCAATPAWPWTFEETEVCTISYDDGATAVTVVFDPRSKLYAINLSRAAGWADAPVFQLRFDGGMPFTIGLTLAGLAYARTEKMGAGLVAIGGIVIMAWGIGSNPYGYAVLWAGYAWIFWNEGRAAKTLTTED
ncbi:MAG: hypothetical protein AAFY07_14000, partial [Pseudomonadota bacterium]